MARANVLLMIITVSLVIIFVRDSTQPKNGIDGK